MRKGFTLIEIVVVVGVMGLLLLVVSNTLFSSFRSKTRIDLADRVEQNGSLVLTELKNNILTAAGVGVSCVTNGVDVGSTISFVNVRDGMVTSLVCYENSKIASESANGKFDLTAGGLKVTGCDDFARCLPFPDSTDRVSRVDFSFSLSTGNTAAGAEKYVNRKFQLNTVIRN